MTELTWEIKDGKAVLTVDKETLKHMLDTHYAVAFEKQCFDCDAISERLYAALKALEDAR